MDPLGKAAHMIPTPLARRISNSPVGELFNWGRKHTTIEKPVTLDTPAGSVTVATPEQSVFYETASETGQYEQPLTTDLIERLDQGDTFYDIGAQFGCISRIAMAAGAPADAVHAFEADSYSASVCRTNVEDDGGYVVNDWVGAGGSTLAIDDYAQSHSLPTSAKIDVEGAEVQVLKGMEDSLSELSLLYIEAHPQFLSTFDTTEEELFEYLSEFSISVLNDHRTGESEWKPLTDATPPSDRAYLIRAER